MNERYPTPIGNFEKWFGDLMSQIKYAKSQNEVDMLLAELKPYVDAQWCFPSRMVEAELQAAKALARASRKQSAGVET